MDHEPSEELLRVLGSNAIQCLNEIPLYCREWIPLLQKLTKGADPSDLQCLLKHGSASNVKKSLEKVATSDSVEMPLFEKEQDSHCIEPIEIEKVESAKDWLVEHTREDDKTHRLYTAEHIPEMYAQYVGSVKTPLCEENFTHIYRSLRILRERHSQYDIYTCPYCDDYYPTTKALIEKLDPSSPDYQECQELFEKLSQHKLRWHTQTKCFYDLWNDPPPGCMVVVEDAGKRFVLDGKGVVHVMMIRWRDLEQAIHEHHYFFCGLNFSSVTRYSIAQSWIALHAVLAPLGIFEFINLIQDWHDGGSNEYNNSSGLVLYSTLERLWKIKITTNTFEGYHGKGAWDGLLGSGVTIMNSHASLIKIDPTLHFDKNFYYRSLASIRGKNAEVSRAYAIEVPNDVNWCAQTMDGISKAKKFNFDVTSEKTFVNCYALSNSPQPFQTVELKLKKTKEEIEEAKKAKEQERTIEIDEKKRRKEEEKRRKEIEKKRKKNEKGPEVLQRQQKKSKKIIDVPFPTGDDEGKNLQITVTNSREVRKKTPTKRYT